MTIRFQRVWPAVLGSLALASSPLLAAPSDLDTTLVHSSPQASGSGTGALVGFAPQSSYVELQSDGRLRFIAAGTSCYNDPQVTGSVLVTLAASGQLQSAAGAPCADAVVPGSIARATAYNAVKLSTGKLLLQSDTEGLDIRLRLIRMNADGSIDTSYGNNGQRIANKSDGSPILSGTGLRDTARMVVDAQDRLYLSAGGSQIARVFADGTLDTSFGTGGYASSPLPNGIITELALDSSGRLLVTGRREEIVPLGIGNLNVAVQRYWLARFDSSGAHDASFRNDLGGSSNIVRVQAVNTDAAIAAGAPILESTGTLVVTVGNTVQRYDSSGTALGSTSAFTETDAASGRGLDITLMFGAVDSNGRIVVAGQGVNTSQQPLVRRTVMARLNTDLGRDTSFDVGDAAPNGLRLYDLGSGRAFPDTRGGVRFGSTGKIHVVGRVDGQAGSSVAVLRLVGDGSSAPVSDTTPEPFDFGVNGNATANSFDVSPAVTITGITVPVAISVDGSAQARGYSIGCSGTFTATAGTIENGQSVCVRHATGSPGTRIVTTLTVGGVTGSFESVVPAPMIDTEPDAYDFPAVIDADPASVVESADRAISGINSTTPIGISGGEYRLSSSGVYTSAPGQLEPGQSVQLRLTASATDGETRTATVTIGGVSATFAVTTRMPAQASTATITGATGGDIRLSTAGGTLVNARTVPLPGAAPSGFSYPNGFYAFDVDSVAPGSEITVQVTLPAASRPNAYVKCNADASSCSEFAGASFSDNTVTLRLQDGGAGDADGLVNGRIVDPGAPAVRAIVAPDPEPEPESSSNSSGGGALGGPLLTMAMIMLGLRRLRERRPH